MPIKIDSRFLTPVAMGLLAVPLVIFGWFVFQRPPQTDWEQDLFDGIRYRREFRSVPRPMMIHVVKVDLTTAGVKALVTPGTPDSDDQHVNARTTSEFLTEFKVQVAVNASFFYPFAEDSPWSYYPHTGDRVNALGQAISNGITYSEASPDWAVLCFAQNQRAQILGKGVCPSGTAQAVAGDTLLVSQGQPAPKAAKGEGSDRPYSRVAVALDQPGKTLWLIAVDGKQPLYSEGMTLDELSKIAIQLGADTALNLDGGGSTTLAIATPTGPKRLNSPIHTKIPMRERPIANHLGFYALPK